MESSGFEPSAIVGIVLAVGFVALVIAVVARMARKKRGVSLLDSVESPSPKPVEQKQDRSKAAAREPSVEKGAAKQQVSSGKPGKASPEPVAPEKVEPQAFLVDIRQAKHMSEGLARTRREGFIARLADTFRKGESLDDSLVAQAEEALLTADMGVRTAMELTEALKTEFRSSGGHLAPQVLSFLKDRTYSMISGQAHGLPPMDAAGLNIIMVVGVNGTGKTTSIAKLANYYRNAGRRVLLAAGDTYRAAGADQLGIWGERLDIPVVVGKPGQDPSALFFDAAKQAVEQGFDLLIADTAGRLHTDTNLVDELKKVHRVLGKACPGAPHEVLLMLDSTMGQNAVRQADVFLKSVQVTGIGLSKLDGTARGGVVISIARDMNLPIRFVGVGEAVEDIRSFEPREFVDALFAAD